MFKIFALMMRIELTFGQQLSITLGCQAFTSGVIQPRHIYQYKNLHQKAEDARIELDAN